MRRTTLPHAGLLCLAAALACETTTTPSSTAPEQTISVTIVSGNGQSAVAGTELPQALKVKVVDASGRIMRGELVNFRVRTGGGTMFAGAALSDNQGNAQDWWTLGTTPGPQSVEVVAVDPTTGEKLVFGTFTATALAPAQLSVSPGSHGFGSAVVGATSGAQAFTVTNSGGAPSGAVSVALGGANAADFTVSGDTCTGVVLAAGASCQFNASFAPTAPGSAIAVVTASASPGGSVGVTLSGSGVVATTLSASPGGLSFGSVQVLAMSASQNITVTNTGGGASGVLSVTLSGPNPGDFILAGPNSCSGNALPVGASCAISIAFRPTSIGARSASVTVSGAPGGSTSSTLTGTGSTSGALTITPSSFDFGTVSPGAISSTRTFTLLNASTSTAGNLQFGVSGAHAADFLAVAGTTCSPGMNLLAGQSCSIVLVFRPSALGSRTATLNATTATPNIAGASAALTGTGAGAVLTLSPTSQTFGSVLVGASSAQVPFTVTNAGTATSGPVVLGKSGVNTGDFIVGGGTCGPPLAVGASCVTYVSFTPLGIGARTAALTASASPGGVASSSLSGTGAATGPNIVISPTSHNFGSVLTGTTSSARTFTVQNTGGSVSSALTVALSGANADDFALPVNSCSGVSLAPGATCTIDVTLTPSVAGAQSGQLDVSATSGGTAAAALSGTGATPATLSISPSSANYGNVPIGSPSYLTFEVHNTGGAASGVIAVVFAGPDASQFTARTDACSGSSLPAGAWCSVTVQFLPNANRSFSATLQASASPGGSAAANLSGTGVP